MQAMHSSVFLFYLSAVVGLLIVAGSVLGVLRWSRVNVDHAWQAYRGWLCMTPVLMLAFFLGRESAIAFLTIVAVLGFREFARATSLSEDRIVTRTVYVGIVSVGCVCGISAPFEGSPGWYGLFMSLPVFVVAAILAIPVLRNRNHDQLRVLGLAVVGFVYFGWMFGHVALLANSRHAYSYLGYVVLAVELNDVAAYVFGKFFGRRPLRSNISPKKTWEGAVGALCVSLALPWILLPTFPHFEAKDCLVAGLVVGVGGQLGDLVVSVFKRDLGIKDMGGLIPGHGGVLDRIDSLVYVAPFLVHYLRCCHDSVAG